MNDSTAVLVTVRTCEILKEWGLFDAFRENSEWVDEVHVHDVEPLVYFHGDYYSVGR